MDRELESRIRKAAEVLRQLGAKEVYLFGSALNGELRRHSDVDLAISGLPPKVFFRAMSAAAEALGRSVDLLDLDKDDPVARYLREEGDLKRVG